MNNRWETTPEPKKILLINPPIQDFYHTTLRQEPLGLGYIAAVLSQHGFHVTLLDTLSEKRSKAIILPQSLAYLADYYPPSDLSPFKLFTHFRHFGLPFEQIDEIVRQTKPAIIGITANFTPYFDTALSTAQLCKKILPAVPVVMGGHHVTVEPHSALQSDFVDFVVMGEGEFTFLKLAEIISQRQYQLLPTLPGIAYKEDQHIRINSAHHFIENLDLLPFPALRATGQQKMIITSRGCPKNCNFCSIEKVMGRKVRFRAITAVIEEIKQALAQKITHIDFEDDTLTINKPRAKELFQALIDQFAGSGITFSAMNGLDADTLDEELIILMKQAGFEWLNVPLVSGAPAVQQQVQRQQSIIKFQDILTIAQKYDLRVVAYIILGLPEDRLEQMLQDIIFLASQRALIGASIFYPPPGTLTYDNCLARGYIHQGDYTILRSSAIPVATAHFSRPDLITLLRLARIINYLKKIIDDRLAHPENLIDYLQHNRIDARNLIFPRKLNAHEIGLLLLPRLFINGELNGLKLKAKLSNEFHYAWLSYVHSPSLITRFLQSISTGIIRGVKTERYVTIQ